MSGPAEVMPGQQRAQRQEEDDVLDHVDQAEPPPEDEILRLREIPGQRVERAIDNQHQQQRDGDPVVAPAGADRVSSVVVRFHTYLSLMAELPLILRPQHAR